MFDAATPVRFIDCGAFTGDTLGVAVNYLTTAGIPIHSITLLEPNSGTRAQLLRRVRDNTNSDFDIVVYPCGAWSEDTILQFERNGSSSTIVGPSRGDDGKPVTDDAVQIHGVAIDEALYGIKSTDIKMDIEGAEIAAWLAPSNHMRPPSGTRRMSLPPTIGSLEHPAADPQLLESI